MHLKYAKHIVEYHLTKLQELGYSRGEIAKITQLNVTKLISDPSYFEKSSHEIYKIIKLLYATPYHYEREIDDTLQAASTPALFNAYLLNSSSVVDLFNKLCKFSKVSYPSNTYWSEETDDSQIFCLQQHALERQFSTSQGFLFFAVKIVHTFLQNEDVFIHVGSTSAQFPDHKGFAKHINGDISYNQPYCYIKLAKTDTHPPANTYSRNIESYLEKQFTLQFAQVTPPNELKDLIVADIKSAMEKGHYSHIFNIDYTCTRYGISRATLYRKLQLAETSFTDIVEQLRQYEAKRLLTQSFLSLSEISERLGYSNLSAFNRAFKRWQNVSPTAFRDSEH